MFKKMPIGRCTDLSRRLSMKFVQQITLVLTVLSGSVLAQSETKCDVAAFVADRHSGVNVRDGAGLNNKIVKTIPRDAGGTLVFIEGSKGEWLKISRAVSAKRVTVFSGVGWVHAPLLFVRTRGGGDDLVLYYRNPRTETEEIGSIRTGLDVVVMGCSGDWMKVLIPKRGTKGVTGWMPTGAWCGSPWEDCV